MQDHLKRFAIYYTRGSGLCSRLLLPQWKWLLGLGTQPSLAAPLLLPFGLPTHHYRVT